MRKIILSTEVLDRQVRKIILLFAFLIRSENFSHCHFACTSAADIGDEPSEDTVPEG